MRVFKAEGGYRHGVLLIIEDIMVVNIHMARDKTKSIRQELLATSTRPFDLPYLIAARQWGQIYLNKGASVDVDAFSVFLRPHSMHSGVPAIRHV